MALLGIGVAFLNMFCYGFALLGPDRPGNYVRLIGEGFLFTLGAPRVPTRRRAEFIYQKSSLLYESGVGLEIGTGL